MVTHGQQRQSFSVDHFDYSNNIELLAVVKHFFNASLLQQGGFPFEYYNERK